MNTRFQLSLILTTLILTVGVLLFGWVYLDSLNNKYESLMHSPLNAEGKISVLEEENKALTDRITNLEQTLNNKLQATATAVQPAASNDPTKLTPGSAIPDGQANKKDVYIDQRCVADPANLKECDILATVKLTDSIQLVVKPNGDLTPDGVNSLTFQFQENGTNYAALHTTTPNLFNTDSPIATVVMTNKNDVTVQTKVGINNILSTYTFDGQGWIDYSKFSQQ